MESRYQENGKAKNSAPDYKDSGTLSVDSRWEKDPNKQGLFLKTGGYVAQALAVKLPDPVNGTWEDLMLKIFPEGKNADVGPLTITHSDLGTKKVVSVLYLPDRELNVTCERK